MKTSITVSLSITDPPTNSNQIKSVLKETEILVQVHCVFQSMELLVANESDGWPVLLSTGIWLSSTRESACVLREWIFDSGTPYVQLKLFMRDIWNSLKSKKARAEALALS